MSKLSAPLLLAAMLLLPGCGILWWLEPEPSPAEAAAKKTRDLPDDLNDLLSVADQSHEASTRKGAYIALAALTKARAVAPDDPEVVWREARSLFWLAQYGEDKQRLPLGRDAVRHAERMIELRPDRVEGHYFRAGSLGLVLQHDPSAGLKRLPEVVASLERAIEINGRFYRAAPHLALGAILLKAPPFPTGPGDLDAALENLEQAVKLAPRWPENWLWLADAKLADGDLAGAKQDAKRAQVLLEGMNGVEAGAWRSKANSILRQIREKRHRNRDPTTF